MKAVKQFAGEAAFSLVIMLVGAAYCFAQQIRVPQPGDMASQAAGAVLANAGLVPSHHCQWIPIRKNCLASIDQINGFYLTATSLSYFGQIKSIYNGASNAAMVSADIASLNFMNGMQITAGANVQAGSAAASSQRLAQAAQNMLYGGTFLVSAIYPILGAGLTSTSTPGNLALSIDAVGRDGIDIQNFKLTSTQVSAMPSHSSAQIEGYVVYNAINAGSVFIGGAYGYSYTSHGYARDYGIPNVSNRLGQISVGIMVNKDVSLTVSRAFGPPQTYFDNGLNRVNMVNNFKAWSIGIRYQSSPPAQ